MTIINSYQNGNCQVTIHSDGTKVREWEGDPNPILPESIDLKITDWCDLGCWFCHESSTIKGKYADIVTIKDSLTDALPGMEVAIGGGNPLSHPDLFIKLEWMKGHQLISNITVNAKHLIYYKKFINILRERQLIFGLGVSYNPSVEQSILDINDNNTVIHMIAGIDHPLSLLKTHKKGLNKFLILGYKKFGRGQNLRRNLNIGEWKYWIATILRLDALISFDNLALEQLNIKGFISPENWTQYYMGNDGQFTMYIDAVKDEYAISSTSHRQYRSGKGLRNMFGSLPYLS